VSAPAKLGAFGLLLATALGGGAALGAALGPIDVDDPAAHGRHEAAIEPASTPGAPGGLAVTDAGYRLIADDRFAEVPSPGTHALFFDFAIDGAVHTARFVIDADGTAGIHPDAAGRPGTDPSDNARPHD